MYAREQGAPPECKELKGDPFPFYVGSVQRSDHKLLQGMSLKNV